MAEPPGAQPALGIDAVEWLATGEGTVTVVVTGRWRRRAAWRGRAMLVIEAQGRHHRFRAIPEPPSVAGATPGTWRMSFSIPAVLAPHLGGQAWLQLGAVVVPLPGVVEAADREPEPGERPDGPESAAEPSTEAQPWTEATGPASGSEEPTEPRVENVIAAAADLSERVQQLERERREAEQRAHAEHARRLELEEQQAALHPQLTAAQSRIAELERQLAEARRPSRSQLSREIAIARSVPPVSPPTPAIPESAAERARAQLRRERDLIASAESGRAAELEPQRRHQMLLAERLYDVIDELRSVLDAIRGVGASAGDTEPVSPPVEPARLDAALARLRETIPPPEPSEVTPAPEAERTSDEPASDDEPAAADEPASEVAAAATRKSWLLRTLRTLAKQDPAAAGRLIVGLLPAGRLAYAQPVAYDLVLADAGCIQVTARGSATRVAEEAVAREQSEVDFRVTGELQTLARLLIAGRVRRRLGRRMARVKGDRKALAALTSLVRTPLGLKELYAAGARLDPPLALGLVTVMIDPKWTVGHRFTIAYRGPDTVLYLRVPGGQKLTVAEQGPLGPVATTIVCEPGALLGVLAGEDQASAVIRGATEPLQLIRDWVQRAHSG